MTILALGDDIFSLLTYPKIEVMSYFKSVTHVSGLYTPHLRSAAVHVPVLGSRNIDRVRVRTGGSSFWLQFFNPICVDPRQSVAEFHPSDPCQSVAKDISVQIRGLLFPLYPSRSVAKDISVPIRGYSRCHRKGARSSRRLIPSDSAMVRACRYSETVIPLFKGGSVASPQGWYWSIMFT
jgi:hypothetical protein